MVGGPADMFGRHRSQMLALSVLTVDTPPQTCSASLMPTLHTLNDPDSWRENLGLMPVPLFGDERERGTYVLLNGGRGNFCLDLSGRGLESEFRAEARNLAWSANVGHYVMLHNDSVYLQRWDQSPASIERHSYTTVSSNLERFLKFLEANAPPADASVVAHTLQVFRSLRSALGQRVGGEGALSAFLYLLAAATERVERDAVSLDAWRLTPASQEVATSIDEGLWRGLVEELLRGRPIEHLRPNLTLMLRHAAGLVFQEAHYAAQFHSEGQLLLDGFSPSPVTVTPETTAIGLHFTPGALARTLVEECIGALEGLPARLVALDPACGSGEFLRELLRQLKLRGYSGAVHLVGFDLSQAACDMANFVLAWEAREYPGQVTVDIRCGDALDPEIQWPADVHLVLMNPPFVSWRDMSPNQQQTVQRILGEHARLRPDLSTAFLWRAVSTLGKVGVLGSILPASFLDGTSFESIRGELGETLVSRLIARLGSHELFHEARIDAALYVGGKGIEPQAPLAFWADYRATSNSAGLRMLRRARSTPGGLSTPIVKSGFSIYPNPRIGRSSGSWAPRPFREWQLLQAVGALPQVRDSFSVQQGTITGLNKVLLITRSEWEALPDPERRYFRPAVLNESVEQGKLRNVAYVFYPYGERALVNEEDLQKAVGTYYSDVLLPNKSALLARKRIKPDRWWLLSEYRAWQVKKTTKLVSTYFGDVGSFAWDETGEYVVVQGYGWLPEPKKGAAKKLTRRIWLAYLALLNSPTFSRLLAATSNHVGGGQWNLSKRFVERIPMPRLEPTGSTDFYFLEELATLGERIHDAGLGKLSPDEKQALADLTQAAYGSPSFE